jgi:hypothetical protein
MPNKIISWEAYETIEFPNINYEPYYDYYYRPLDYMSVARKTFVLDDVKDNEDYIIISKGK